MPQDPTGELDRRSEFPAFATDRSEPQQRDVTHRLMITRLRSGAISMAIISRRSASLMAARTFALPTLARSAIRATGRAHFPVAAASFRMTASTAIASVFRSSLIEGGTTTVAQEIDGPTLHVGRSPTCYDFLPSGSRSRPPSGGQVRPRNRRALYLSTAGARLK